MFTVMCEVCVGTFCPVAVRVMVKLDPFTENPHPDIHNDPAMRNAVTTRRTDHAATRDRFFRFDNPRREINPHGITRPKASFPPGEPPGALFCAAVLDIAARILNVLDAGAPLGVTVGELESAAACSCMALRSRLG